MTKIIVN